MLVMLLSLLSIPWVMTALALLVGAGVLFGRIRKTTSAVQALPGKLNAEGSIALTAGDIGDADETLRDMSRAYRAGGIWLLTTDALQQLRPPAGAPDGLDPESLAACRAALMATLGVKSDALSRLVPMLSVGPAFAVLTRSGCLPSLQNHRYVIARGPHDLRAITIGYLPDGKGGAPKLLTLTSAELLSPTTDDAARVLSYDLRPPAKSIARHTAPSAIEAEIRACAPRWREAYIHTS